MSQIMSLEKDTRRGFDCLPDELFTEDDEYGKIVTAAEVRAIEKEEEEERKAKKREEGRAKRAASLGIKVEKKEEKKKTEDELLLEQENELKKLEENKEEEKEEEDKYMDRDEDQEKLDKDKFKDSDDEEYFEEKRIAEEEKENIQLNKKKLKADEEKPKTEDDFIKEILGNREVKKRGTVKYSILINKFSIEKMIKDSLKDDSIKGANDMSGLRDWPTKGKRSLKKPKNNIKTILPVNNNINGNFS